MKEATHRRLTLVKNETRLEGKIKILAGRSRQGPHQDRFAAANTSSTGEGLLRNQLT